MLKIYRWIIFFLLSCAPALSYAQGKPVPTDSTQFIDFLKLQDEIPGLGYRIAITDANPNNVLIGDSLFRFTRTDSGFVSKLFNEFSWIDEMERLSGTDRHQLHFVVLSEPTSLAETRNYVSHLIENGDYLVKSEEKIPVEDLVLLAANSPYSPLQDIKLKFLSDYRLFAVTLIIVVFLVVASVMIVSMLVMKVRKSKIENLKKEYDQLIIDPLTSLLFEKEMKEISMMNQDEIYTFFPENLLSKKLYQDTLIERIIGLNKKMKGEFKGKLKILYKRLGLDEVSIKSLHHRKWDRVTMALVQINEMDLVEALPEVRKIVNSANFHIRSKAVSTLLNLSENVDLNFLRDQTYPLSVWQQMNYLRIIKFMSSHKSLKLEILFDSKNQSIRIFGIKLVRILGRVDLIGTLAGFADQVSDDEQIEILETYAALGAHMESAFINACLKSPSRRISAAAAKAAAVIGDVDSEEIIVELLQTETDFRLKLIYLKGLFALNRQKFDAVTLSNDSEELMEIRSHILDPMLQNV